MKEKYIGKYIGISLFVAQAIARKKDEQYEAQALPYNHKLWDFDMRIKDTQYNLKKKLWWHNVEEAR